MLGGSRKSGMFSPISTQSRVVELERILPHGHHKVLVRSPPKHHVRFACVVGARRITVEHLHDSRSTDHDEGTRLDSLLTRWWFARKRGVIARMRAALQHISKLYKSFQRLLMRQQCFEPFRGAPRGRGDAAEACLFWKPGCWALHQPFNSRLTSLKIRQSVPSARILLGVALINPDSRSRSA